MFLETLSVIFVNGNCQ